MKTVTKTVKLSPTLTQALKRAAMREQKTESELIREGIELVVAGRRGLNMKALIGDDVGIGDGPPDLSSNRDHLSGYGRTRHR